MSTNGGNERRCCRCRKQYGGSSKKKKEKSQTELLHDPATLFLGTPPKESKAGT